MQSFIYNREKFEATPVYYWQPVKLFHGGCCTGPFGLFIDDSYSLVLDFLIWFGGSERCVFRMELTQSSWDSTRVHIINFVVAIVRYFLTFLIRWIPYSADLAHAITCCLKDNVSSRRTPRNFIVFEQLTVVSLIVIESRFFLLSRWVVSKVMK